MHFCIVSVKALNRYDVKKMDNQTGGITMTKKEVSVAKLARLLELNPSLAPGDFLPGRVICVP